ncbi:putative PurR-regulated permease PerM [Acetoanaerobium pronyense]|uniref:PurR-regulated permease PerM n=1 Tax=Acetoanaerobium pronyense TaxID=1482736 RepID=A0ABS4KLT3_9FIRM|nr:AI-2E family transporter [Acetoanaerobium pronyense]MBP2028742.1 putative PurR-regulated permease PerM [Acetoanaerobium pronyense]
MKIFYDKTLNRLIKFVLFLLILFLLYQVEFFFRPFLRAIYFLFVPIIIAALFFYLLRPVVDILEKKFSKTISASIAFALFLVILLGGIGFIGYFLVDQIDEVFELVRTQYENFRSNPNKIIPNPLSGYIDFSDFENQFGDIINQSTQWFQDNFVSMFNSIKEVSSQTILIPFLLFYLLKDHEKFYALFIKALPRKKRHPIAKITGEIDEVLSVYVKGQLIVALFIGIGMFIVYLIIGMPMALVLSTFTFVTSVIPFLGPILGILPALLIAVGESFWMVIKLIIGTIIIQQIESDLISPNVIGKKLSIHPLTIIIVIMLAVNSYGILGAFVAVPGYAIFRVITLHFYNKYMERENLQGSEVKD